MCGIIAVLRRREQSDPVSPSVIDEWLDAACRAVAPGEQNWNGALERLAEAATFLQRMNESLLGSAGLRCMIEHPGLTERLEVSLTELEQRIVSLESALDAGEKALSALTVESINSAIIRVKDALWAVRNDRVRNSRAVADLAGPDPGPAALDGYASIQTALSALDRLEVRGRDSAGLHVLVSGHGLELESPKIRAMLEPGLSNRLFTSGAVRTPAGQLGFVYKAAAEIGELGDNGAELRRAIRGDALLRLALGGENASAAVLGHTRWASVGFVSQANAHPLNQEELDQEPGSEAMPFVTAVLNGDVDNHADLEAHEALRIPPEITTDAKVIPVLVSRRLAAGRSLEDAFRQTVASFEGSVAIAAQAALDPERLLLALHGSGQALYVGLGRESFIVASEPYGVIEECSTYLRMDGERPGNPDHPSASRGQIIVLDRGQAGRVGGIRRMAYDGTELPVEARDLTGADITTRDIDRGSFPHFLLKEINEAPRSFQKTLRGKIREEDGKLRVTLGSETLGEGLRDRLSDGRIRRIHVIGQGTAAVAGRGVALALAETLAESRIPVSALPATELSGFGMREDMSDTLAIAVSQSGTTTDTNRTVDLLRARGAVVVSIVNRRGSDLTDKSDGVLYTSDGRDIEMSVASTKAFYAQIAAGFLLAFAIAREVGCADDRVEDETLRSLRALPVALERVLETSERIAEAAREHAPSRRHWAIVGNGRNRVAAEEIRIKLSELCYRSIACDTTEDKKHIDLSSEPLILVCAAGLTGSTASDVAKEVAIYKAHRGAPIVIASEGCHAFPAAFEILAVPDVHPSLAFILATMAGHLFGYHAALAIDTLARPLHEARAVIEKLASAAEPGNEQLLWRLEERMKPLGQVFFDGLRDGSYDGQLEASTAVRLASTFRYVLGLIPLETYQEERGGSGTPGRILEDHSVALTRAIEELTRPVDAIKHQAKTVTVGISRSDAALLEVPLVQEVLKAGASRDRIRYRDLRTLAALNPAVLRVKGYTRYRVFGSLEDDTAMLEVVGSGGIALAFPSRTGEDPTLRGTKHLVARELMIIVTRGRSDGRMVMVVPEVQKHVAVGLTLLHLEFHERLPASVLRGVLTGYRNRYAALKEAVTETEPAFREELLESVSVADLLSEPIHALVERWQEA